MALRVLGAATVLVEHAKLDPDDAHALQDALQSRIAVTTSTNRPPGKRTCYNFQYIAAWDTWCEMGQNAGTVVPADFFQRMLLEDPHITIEHIGMFTHDRKRVTLYAPGPKAAFAERRVRKALAWCMRHFMAKWVFRPGGPRMVTAMHEALAEQKCT